MRTRTLVVLAALTLAATIVHAQAPELKTDDDKTLYALGQALSRNVVPFNLSPAELELVKEGLSDGALNKPSKIEVETYMPKIHQLAQARAAAAAETEKKAAKPFLDKAAAEKGAVKTASGMIYQEIKAGTGDQPKPTDKVKVHYKGTLTDGTVFDSSIDRGQPATFPLNGVIKCWTEGLGMMKVGGKAKLVCPSDIAYGDQGRPPKIKPGVPLVFEVELLEIVK
ncbi:MAG TPA: FKBP-type peptidyl-prolyl cis-trans isomerase [Candidatus Acidoferrales bacterium]|nr:FKBP-type peptidyl-prolyl cis-trans isomerase [Candidatus Acidoferrales bacterium]